MALDDGPPQRTCACPSWDSYECWAWRYDMELEASLIEMDGGPCDCSCHAEFDEWAEEE